MIVPLVVAFIAFLAYQAWSAWLDHQLQIKALELGCKSEKKERALDDLSIEELEARLK